MKTPKFLRDLITSPAYMDKNSKVYAMVEKYLNLLYPGTAQTDATGRMTEPEYDMTLEQFNEAQRQIDADFEESKNEVEEEILEEYGEYFENLGISFDIEACVIPGENISVKVLYDDDVILMRHLETYGLDIPNFEKVRKIWIWHSEEGDNTCDECASHDGEIYESEENIPEIPVHLNCRCTITEDVIDPDGCTLSSKPYSSKVKEEKNEIEKDVKNMKMSDDGIAALKQQEGSVKQDGKHVVYNDQTGKPVLVDALLPLGATIGYGHLIKPGEDFRGGITEDTATQLLRNDVAAAERAVQDNITAPITQNQYDALVMLAYNIGSDAFKKSTVVQYINNPDFTSSKYPSLESAWGAWNKSGGRVIPGLIKRRDYEFGIYSASAY